MNHPIIFYIQIVVPGIAGIGIIYLCLSIYKSRKFIRQCKAYNAALKEYNQEVKKYSYSLTIEGQRHLDNLRMKAESLKPDSFDNF